MTVVPGALRRQWWMTTLTVAFATGVVVVAATRAFGLALAVMWLAAAVLPISYIQWFLHRSLALNRPPDPSPSVSKAAVADGGIKIYPTLGLANRITVGRGWLYAGVAGFLLVIP